MKTIVWDVDDVLNDLMRAWFEGCWLAKNPGCKVTYDQITENPPANILGIECDEYLRSLDDFRLSDSYQKMKPLPQVMDWFRKNGDLYHHVALTAVPHIASQASAEWVFKNFGTWIRTFHFVPSGRKEEEIPDYDKNKGEFLDRFAIGDVFIDDSPKNISEVNQEKIKTLLMPRPWNGSARSIADILDELNSFLAHP